MPPSPPSLHVTESTPSTVRLQWTVDHDGGAPVEQVTLYYRLVLSSLGQLSVSLYDCVQVLVLPLWSKLLCHEIVHVFTFLVVNAVIGIQFLVIDAATGMLHIFFIMEAFTKNIITRSDVHLVSH